MHQTRRNMAKCSSVRHPVRWLCCVLVVAIGLACLPVAAVAMVIHIEDATGNAGGTATVDVTLDTEEQTIVATQNNIHFSPQAKIAVGPGGSPDCAVNPAIDKEQSLFSFRPTGCDPGETCTTVRALIFSAVSQTPIPDGATLYSCRIAVAEGASGGFPLLCEGPEGSDPDGGAVPATCTDGSVLVEEEPPINACPGDFDQSGAVTIDELVQAVRSLLDGCPKP